MVWVEPRSHAASMLRPIHADLLGSVSTKSQVTFSTSLSLRMVVMWRVASACPCVHEQVVKKTEAAEEVRGSSWILARFGLRSMLSLSSESQHLSSLGFSPPPAFSFCCCSTLCSSMVSSYLRRATFSLTQGRRVCCNTDVPLHC